ncbi:alpha/beta fold hydrolase [Kibdelosporangium phytohabitans]|uniref:Alpha/beta hydrolase n=1 Tax=Kibdelosporangium phytohabitans TaxID=860235 RepID=A0A0N9I290_9PSEU|nr:alpha/beta fold hydrolase [Kibdelosporangium phytohabitans]ALG10144.1 alpha/beta hydrolase [Kibdelosporangium phytohabitans]MBE1461139.1 pimeloyl-ACP methyl ester carboxylesterase [Kibdelosporangium phytohabitans]
MAETSADINGVRICYETIGDPGGRPLLLVMGLGGPMIWWDDELCELLADRGFRVIRFDNRDCGRSQSMTGQASLVGSLLGSWTGARVGQPPPYTLADMADDAAGLLDHLGIDAAHVTGVSLGGMIAQTLAIRHPARVTSLVSVMSTTGGRRVGWPHPRVLPSLLGRAPRGRQAYEEAVLATFKLIGSPGFDFDEERMRVRARRTYDRGINRAGTLRQLVAITSAADRAPRLRGLRVPALVIHGKADPLVHVSGGTATARAIPGAELILVPGMGHDLPRAVWPTLVDGVDRTARRAVSSHT